MSNCNKVITSLRQCNIEKCVKLNYRMYHKREILFTDLYFLGACLTAPNLEIGNLSKSTIPEIVTSNYF